MKIGIIGLLGSSATSENSHSSGMVRIVSKLFNADILNAQSDLDKYDKLIIYHGPNYKEGSFNVIGGITNTILEMCEKVSKYNGEIVTLDGFQLNEFSKKRKINRWDSFKNIEKIELPDRENCVIGDSHSISVWPNESYTIKRMDGKTLFGFLKLNIDLSNYQNTILYFGNIDLRFHLCRQNDPEKATIDLFERYCEYAKKYNSTIVQLLPIEDESRVLPKSGWYKGKTFFGSINYRKKLRKVANDVMLSSGLKLLEWPDYFVDEKGNLKFEIMKPKQSVHIRPKYYMNNIKRQLSIL